MALAPNKMQKKNRMKLILRKTFKDFMTWSTSNYSINLELFKKLATCY